MVNARDLLIYLHIKFDGDWNKTYSFIKTKQKLDKEDMKKTLEGVDMDKYITLHDDDYPERFKAEMKPPFVIERNRYSAEEKVIALLKKELAEAMLKRCDPDERDLLFETIAFIKNREIDHGSD